MKMLLLLLLLLPLQILSVLIFWPYRASCRRILVGMTATPFSYDDDEFADAATATATAAALYGLMARKAFAAIFKQSRD